MIKSMTGFGRCEKTVNGLDIIIEIKSVNHRYFEFSSRTSKGYGFLDDKIKTYLQSKIIRGKIDVFLSITNVDSVDSDVVINHSLLSGYVKAYNEIAEKYNVKNDISVSNLLRFPDVLSLHKASENEDEIWDSVFSVLQVACENFLTMRSREGVNMSVDLKNRANTLIEKVKLVEELSPQTVVQYRERLFNKLSEILNDKSIDEQRILTECAIFADKIAVDEETVRLRSHISEFNGMLKNDSGVGRKLDFIVQEMNREVNTIGSKATNSEIAKIVIDMKAEIEKIREQVQNIE